MENKEVFTTINKTSSTPGLSFVVWNTVLLVAILVCLDLSFIFIKKFLLGYATLLGAFSGGIIAIPLYYFTLFLPIILTGVVMYLIARRITRRTGEKRYIYVFAGIALLYSIMVPFLSLGALSSNPILRKISVYTGGDERQSDEGTLGALTPFVSPIINKIIIHPILAERNRQGLIKELEQGLIFGKEFQFSTQSLCFLRDYKRPDDFASTELLWTGELVWPKDSFFSEDRLAPSIVFANQMTSFDNLGFGAHLPHPRSGPMPQYITDPAQIPSTRKTKTYRIISLFNSRYRTIDNPQDLKIIMDIMSPAKIPIVTHFNSLPQDTSDFIKMLLNKYKGGEYPVREFQSSPDLLCDKKTSDFIGLSPSR